MEGLAQWETTLLPVALLVLIVGMLINSGLFLLSPRQPKMVGSLAAVGAVTAAVGFALSSRMAGIASGVLVFAGILLFTLAMLLSTRKAAE